MGYQRLRFRLAASGGAAGGDTGRLTGALAQIRWSPAAADTGQIGTLALSLLPQEGDSGGPGWTFYSESGVNLGAAFTRSPRQPQHGPDGAPDPADTGAAFGVPIVGANDRLRAKITPADTGVVVTGSLYAWTNA
jgi:hypothetical protein